TLNDEQAAEFGRLYRRVASDLNQAQTFVSGDATVQYLNDLVARCYLVIYARTRFDLRAFLRHLLLGFPAAFRHFRWRVALALIFVAAGGLFCALAAYPEPA